MTSVRASHNAHTCSLQLQLPPHLATITTSLHSGITSTTLYMMHVEIRELPDTEQDMKEILAWETEATEAFENLPLDC